MKLKLPERRRFVRVETPLRVIVKSGERTDEVVTKNISPVGMRFEVGQKLDDAATLDMQLFLPSTSEPIDLVGRVVWQNKTSLEDKAPYDVGIEITHIQDANKNVFLKFLCDLLYQSIYRART